MFNFLEQYSKIQRQAVMHGEGAMLVSAGPGSGKTHVLTGRVYYLIAAMKVPPESIVVITFTKEAALSMERRFYQLIEELNLSIEDFQGVRFSTFHSFYYQILKDSNQFQNYSIINDYSQRKLVQYLVETEDNKIEKGSFRACNIHEADSIRRAISLYKNTMNQEAYINAFPEYRKEEAWKYFKLYEKELENRKMLDMDDLVYKTLNILKSNKTLVNSYQERYQHYLVDEFQDSNIIQYRVMRILTQKVRSIFAVGDEDQAIYGFRGAAPGIMERYIKDYAGCRVLFMGENYRSYPQIVSAASNVISQSKYRLKKDIRSMKQTEQGEGGTVEKKVFGQRKEEWEYVCKCLKEMDHAKVKNTAILFRTNFHLSAFIAMLKSKGIPYITRENAGCIYQHFVVQDVMAYLLAGSGRRERELFLRIFRIPFIGVGRESLTEELVDLEALKVFYSRGAYANRLTVEQVDKLKRKLNMLQRMSPSLGLNFIRKACGYDNYIRERYEKDQELYSQCMDILDYLQGESSDFKTVEEWAGAQERYKEQFQKERSRGKRREKEEGVYVMTLHGAKGLEFEHVFIMDVNEGVIPKFGKGSELPEEKVEEERRLFYVGMTRAKKRLELLLVIETNNSKLRPSRFLEKVK